MWDIYTCIKHVCVFNGDQWYDGIESFYKIFYSVKIRCVD